MNLDLENKVILVSGGSKGIGRAISECVAQEAAIPFVVSRNKASLEEMQHSFDQKKWPLGTFQAELTEPEACEAAVAAAVAKFGRLDGLVNNAGINDSVGLEKGNYNAFVQSLERSLVHYYLLAHHALPHLKKTKGAIINIGSKVATTGQGNTSGYAAANGGRNALTREWALELLPYSIRVNAVIVAESYTPLYKKWIQSLPNPEETLKKITDKIPLERRMTEPMEIANAVAFLLSERSTHTTGQLFYVDGGYTHLDRAL
jgi:L-fucose dehydrogenase